MPTIQTPLAPLFVLPLLAACAATPRPALAPLQGARPQELRMAVEPLSHPHRPPLGDVQPAEDGDVAVSVRVRLLTAPSKVLAQAVGEQAESLFAVVCARDQARGLVDALLAEGGGGVETNDTTLTLRADQDGYLSVRSQLAYIAGFDLVADGSSVIADPRVDVAQEGVLLQVRASREPGGWALALELDCAELDRPLEERSLELGPGGARVTLQVPAGIVRRLTCGASPAADEALLLGGAALTSSPRSRGTPLLLIELDPLAPDGESIARR